MKQGFLPFANGIANTYSLENFERFAEPLGRVSKRFVSSNFTPVPFEHKLQDDFLKAWLSLVAESRGKWVDADSAYRYLLKNSASFVMAINAIQTALLYAFDRKVENESRVLVFSSREITKRFLTTFARFGYLEIAGNLVESEIDYMTGSGYGYSYYYEDRNASVTLFDATYFRFGPIPTFADSASEDHHVSGKDIFLSLRTPTEKLESIARFAFLQRIDTHIVLEITRETLIRAKNELGFALPEIAPIFVSLGVELPKSTLAMIASVDDTASDVVIFPVGIPVFFKQKGIFDEFASRKAFAKHIVYADPERLMIVFKDSFKKLESTFTERHVFFEQRGGGKGGG
jgi:hypothetical protein